MTGVQHYLLSAGLALAGGRGIADFIGEIKEVQGRNQQGQRLQLH